ncbi:MAG: AAA family ATPase [Candidatus Sumerlaeia bacterium]
MKIPRIPADARKVTIEGVELVLAHEDRIDMKWIGSEPLREQLVAAWTVLGPEDLPLNPRLIGRPGSGKTTLAYSVAASLNQPVYIFQCTMDTRPEDLLISPVIAGEGRIAYHASPLVTAMLRGAVCILDEANRMSEKSWASLAPLLDRRRYVESIVAGLKLHAHPDFRICCTMNDDASTYEVPEYIQSRLQPMIEVTFPTRDEESRILKFNVPLAGEELIELTVAFLQKAHQLDLAFTPRDGINLLRYCLKLAAVRGVDPQLFFDDGIAAVLGRDGVDFSNGIVPAGARTAPIIDEDAGLDFGDIGEDPDDDDDGHPFNEDWKPPF